jgi:pyruvate, water dikinase
MKYVLWFEDAESFSGEAVGGKFSSLAEIAAAGFAVPRAFAVTAEAYRRFLRENGLEEAARAASDVEAGKAMQAAIEAAPLPARVADLIAEAYVRLGDEVPVAVRSSAVAEDLEGASFAGQYETYLWIRGTDAVLEHVRRCWTSLFSAEVLTYRPGGLASGLGMAVVVQEMVQSRAAGVMFTLDPVTGDRSKIVIEGAWGLGEAVVSGLVTPDRFRLDKVTLEIVERAIADKPQEYRVDPDGAAGLRPVPADRRGVACLEEAQVSALAALAKRIEQHRRAPQDIEWAVDEGERVYILQVRPETVWSRRAPQAVSVGGKSALELVLGTFVGGGRTTASEGSEAGT